MEPTNGVLYVRYRALENLSNRGGTRAAGSRRAAEIGDRKQSDSYTDMYACAPLSVSVITQNGGRSLDVLPASCRFDRGSKQSSTKLLLPFSGSRTPHRWPPKDCPGPALPQGRYSLFILRSKLGFERFCSPQE